MRERTRRHTRHAAALISAVAILVIAAAFAALLLHTHGAQLASEETGIHRLRAQAAAQAATHLTLWKLSNDADWQQAMARVVYERDTSFSADPLFEINGDLAGATFEVNVWPGPDTVRLKATGISGGAYAERWAQAPMLLAAADNLLVGGDFENPDAISSTSYWRGAASLNSWIAGYGIREGGSSWRDYLRAYFWTVDSDAGNHFAHGPRWENTMGQYVDGQGAKGRMTLEFDYLLRAGSLTVTVRGVDRLPRGGLLYPNNRTYRDWAHAGKVLYESGRLPRAKDWKHRSVTVDARDGYEYYAVMITSQGGSYRPTSAERAVDNLSLVADQ